MALNVPEEEHDIFECQVCMEGMIQKQPRLLPCAHSFCTPCLRQIFKDKQIRCPTCRQQFPVNQVDQIPVNISLVKMKQLEIDLMKKHVDSNVCKFCLSNGKKVNAVVKCNDCERKMCEECSRYHEKLAAFKGHKVILIEHDKAYKCVKHGLVLKFFCQKCVKPLCVDCTFENEHADHTDKVEEIDVGLAKSTELLYKDIDKLVKHYDMQYVQSVREIKARIRHQFFKVQKQAQEEHDTLLESLPKEGELFEIRSSLDKSKLELSILKESGELDLVQGFTVCEAANTCLASAIERQRELKKFDFTEAEMGKRSLIGTIKEQQIEGCAEHARPKLIVDLNCSDIGILRPSEADFSEDFIFVSDHAHYNVMMISTAGVLMRKFSMNKGFGSVNAVKAFEQQLYVGQKTTLTVLSFNNRFKNEIVYKPYMTSIGGIDVVGPGIVLIADYVGKRVVRFDCNNNSTQTVISGLNKPETVSYGCNLCVVNDTQRNTVNIYNSSWQLLAVLERNKFVPMGATILPTGNIIVSQHSEHRICEYNQTGSFLRCVLDDIRYPMIIRYANGKFLVMQRHKQSNYVGVKLFSFNPNSAVQSQRAVSAKSSI